MQCLILAAGRGSRLGKYIPDTPKCLLEIARRRLIEHQLEALSEAGIAPVGMVLGYCADEVREVVGIQAEYIHNPQWAHTNSLFSFVQAEPWIKGPLIVMNCDILFDPGILERLLATPGNALVFDSSSGRGLEQMKVKAEGGRLVEISKTMPMDEASGENVGILRFTEETARALFEKGRELIAAGNEKAWLASAVQAIAREHPIQAVDIAGLPWAEVDTAYDLEHARKTIWPEIERRWPSRKIRRPTPRWAKVALVASMALALVAASRGTVSSSGSEMPAEWETLALSGARHYEIARKGRLQDWWLIEDAADAYVELEGPVEARVESRLITKDLDSTATPYVLRALVNGRLHDYFKMVARPDAHVSGESVISKRHQAKILVPEGTHRIALGCLSNEGSPCLLRVQVKEQDNSCAVEPSSCWAQLREASLSEDESQRPH